MIKTRPYWMILILIGMTLVGNACNKNAKKNGQPEQEQTIADKTEGVIEVVTTQMDFKLKKELKSGWNTFRYVNNSNEPHFFIFEKMPDSVRIENYKNELMPPFLAAFNYFKEGNQEAGMKEFEKIPDWFHKVELGGGVGLTSPHTTSESTIYLEPGVYVMECYVRMPDGMPHAFMGMLEEVIVSEENTNRKIPVADAAISVSSVDGISFLETLTPGDYTFSVNFRDQKLYETLLGHDVNLVKIENPSQLDSLNNWINAGDFTAFSTPAPEGLLFLGGVEDLQAGREGFFNVSLSEGSYVLISEVPMAVERKMYKLFTVSN